MDRRTIKKIVVVGGGSAGWLTALYAKKMLPEREVVLVESDSIGILGAGEGTTPHVDMLTSLLDIPLSGLANNTECTIKNGIKFVNWNGGGVSDYFYNGFFPYNDLDMSSYDLPYLDSSAPTIFAGSVYRGEPFGSADFASKISDLNRLPFIKSVEDGGMISYKKLSSYAVNVDASKLAEYLKTIATKEKGIRRVEGIVVDLTQDESGDVTNIVLEDGNKISCDFVFDCSGFFRFFAKKFETEWKSHENILPSDAALPFFLPLTDDDPIPTCAIATAMGNGWMWKTPLQHRYGCGYVFNSSLISFDEAQKEVEEYLGTEVEPIKEIRYKAGYYLEPWKHNVVSIGLAYGFIEPLEASSMWVTVVSLREVFSNIEVLFNRDPRVAEDFNKKMSKMSDQVADFIYFHHMTSRSDTEFWRSFTEEKAPSGVKKFLDTCEIRLPSRSDFKDSYWEMDTWFRVGLAHNNKTVIDSVKRSNMFNPSMKSIIQNYEYYKKLVDQLAPMCISHREFISDIKELQ